MIFVFQLVLFALVVLSFLLVIGVPVVFASPESWVQNKALVLIRTRAWFLLVLTVGILDSFVVLKLDNSLSIEIENYLKVYYF